MRYFNAAVMIVALSFGASTHASDFSARVEASALLDEMNMRTQFEERRLRVEAGFASALPDLAFDGVRIAQVLTNLLSNAVKFSPVGGRIEVFAEPWLGGVRIGVRDEGEGIDPADLPNAGAVTKHLFPNVSWTTWDGRKRVKSPLHAKRRAMGGNASASSEGAIISSALRTRCARQAGGQWSRK